ncbi:hypothetical protein [Mesorhizobium sp.]|uniref:Mu transposase domain-containing protein n=1 Tax=Mesorhizobium sp. TaxID=1871066 RepID=UPI00257CF221|nr:hypothetical protein [Mesorhizobium sp.]
MSMTFFSVKGSPRQLRYPSCRRDLFEAMERLALAVLPAEEYEFAEWRLARVSTDYHVEFERYFYSVPHSLIREQVDVRATSRALKEQGRKNALLILVSKTGELRFVTTRMD